MPNQGGTAGITSRPCNLKLRGQDVLFFAQSESITFDWISATSG
ncbi:hypothetical protein SPACI_030600 [Sporomusa acidovorans DSM 3132]|uniref:Uncharacterized protein n=1 Tax=Sporomusa acidovorans (strain ATCC 49682 / DSM 3132 / Mol) TaxID=1123286 RepID=A0ABZ3J3P6_SPOA4|nr:hypothetical protein SPACI_23310 [Sporomusa acidovorans DSM 3132]SDE62502.1 hypothetical protein SAMN04488499_1017123 [Sporomusa acidovorans]